MIKRRFYKLEHGGKNDFSDSGSSSDSDAEHQSSDNDSEIELEEEEDTEQQNPELKSDDASTPQSSSGYESGYSFWDEVEGKLAGKLESEDEVETKSIRQNRPLDDQFSNKGVSDKENVQAELDALLTCDDDKWYILKLKSVYKCRICPTVICLNEESLITHLKSKRHSRSKKLLADGRLEIMLNNFGDPESDGLTHTERRANIVTAMPDDEKEKKKNRVKGRQRQRLRLKRKREKSSSNKEKNNSNMKKSEFERGKPAKKKRKNVKGKA